jgi:hypothetical protein
MMRVSSVNLSKWRYALVKRIMGLEGLAMKQTAFRPDLMSPAALERRSVEMPANDADVASNIYL